jgi:hypothetical protein
MPVDHVFFFFAESDQMISFEDLSPKVGFGYIGSCVPEIRARLTACICLPMLRCFVKSRIIKAEIPGKM